VTELVRDALAVFDWTVLVYFLVLNSTYLLLIALATFDVGHTMRRSSFAGHDDVFANPLTPAVSMVAPAYNEEVTIVDSVRAMLALKYPVHEVIVVDDGSTDRTFELLRDAFDLVPVERVIPDDVPTVGAVRSVHAARGGAPLVVVRKDNGAGRSDPLNVGINAARHPLVCVVDADSLLDEESLLRVAKPFVDDPVRVVASGGVIRAINGSIVERGRLIEPRMPRRWIARVQVVEYLRSFLLGRTGWSRLDGLLIISGAFGLFRRDLLVEVGGMDLTTIGEDAELVAKIHHTLRREKRDYRIVFVAEPVCWTEVPESATVLARQRRRWSRGLCEVLWKHRGMMFNPRYGRIGMVTMPYYLFFELLGPVVELTGIVAVSLGLALGFVNMPFALLFALVALGYGLLLSVTAVAVEEMTFHRYRRWRDLGIALLATLVEFVGYRQLHAWWRLQGIVSALRRKEHTWGVMTRTGFSAPAQAALETAATRIDEAYGSVRPSHRAK
jgi:cellulose synthase/poly-beta-1,6-N-acetylglucosamine synthase-like glycosyltransferase